VVDCPVYLLSGWLFKNAAATTTTTNTTISTAAADLLTSKRPRFMPENIVRLIDFQLCILTGSLWACL